MCIFLLNFFKIDPGSWISSKGVERNDESEFEEEDKSLKKKKVAYALGEHCNMLCRTRFVFAPAHIYLPSTSTSSTPTPTSSENPFLFYFTFHVSVRF